jgi:hypothetical protein
MGAMPWEEDRCERASLRGVVASGSADASRGTEETRASQGRPGIAPSGGGGSSSGETEEEGLQRLAVDSHPRSVVRR